MNVKELDRQTGRTTRMLQDVEKRVIENKLATVIFASQLEYDYLKTHFLVLASPYVTVRIFNPKELNISELIRQDQGDIFIDHAVLEKHFSLLISVLNRYRLPTVSRT